MNLKKEVSVAKIAKDAEDLFRGGFFGRTVQKDPQVEQTLALSKELHDWFKAANGKNALCCRILTKEFDMGAGEHKEQCIHFTGLVAGKVAEMIIREKGLTNIDE